MMMTFSHSTSLAVMFRLTDVKYTVLDRWIRVEPKWIFLASYYNLLSVCFGENQVGKALVIIIAF